MSSPQHPNGPGTPQWNDPRGQHPGPNSQPPQQSGDFGAGPGVYGSGPGQYGSGPGQFGPGSQGPGSQGPQYGPGSQGQQYGSGPGQYGSGPDQYGPGPDQYGSGPALQGQQYGPGSQGQQFGSGPGQYGAGPGPYGSGPAQFGPGGRPQRPRRTGSNLVGPLTLRDLFLLFAGLLALVVLFVPYKTYEFISVPLWAWNIDSMSTLFFIVLTIVLIAAAVLTNKFGSGRMRVGSLSLDQFISVLSGVAFAFAFLQLITSVPAWSIGAYFAFFAALIAFFAGVFTMLPFFAGEFSTREDITAHAKARPVSTHVKHPAPHANVPGGFGTGPGSGAGSLPGQQDWPGAQGEPSSHDQVGSGHGQFGHDQVGRDRVGSGYGQFDGGQQSSQIEQGQQGFGQQASRSDHGQQGFGQQESPSDHGQQAPEQHEFGSAASARPAFGASDHSASTESHGRHAYQANAESADSDASPARPESSFAPPAAETSVPDDSGQSVQSTGSGQTYLGDQHPRDPRHSQSEPTQTFGLGAQRDESPWQSESQSPSAPEAPAAEDPAEAGRSEGRHAADGRTDQDTVAINETVVSDDSAAAARDVTVTSVSERRRGRHAAAVDAGPDGDADARARYDAGANPDAGARPDAGVNRVAGASSDSGADRDSGANRKTDTNRAWGAGDEVESNGTGSLRSTVPEDGVIESETATVADEPGPGPRGVFVGGTAAATDGHVDGTAARSETEPAAQRRDDTTDTEPAAQRRAGTAGTEPAAQRRDGTTGTEFGSAAADSGGASAADASTESEPNIRSTEATVVTADGEIDQSPGADPTGSEIDGDPSDRRSPSAEGLEYEEPSAGTGSFETTEDDSTVRTDDETVQFDAAADRHGAPAGGEPPSRHGAPVGDETQPRDGAADRGLRSDETASERFTPPEADEPTQYVPMANYRTETSESSTRDSGDSAADRDSGDSAANRDSGDDRPSEERPVTQAFWFAVPEPREAVDDSTGMPVFTIYPGDWFLALEDRGSSFAVRDADGKEGVLRNIEGIQRG